jgi:hypothetical protein
MAARPATPKFVSVPLSFFTRFALSRHRAFALEISLSRVKASLTYMSINLHLLLEAGKLVQVRVALGPRRQPLRRILVTREFGEWSSSLSVERSPRAIVSERDELASAFSDFIGRAKLGGTITEVSPPKGEGLFKIKTPQLRLFGWAANPQTLVLAVGARKQDIVDRIESQRSCGARVVALRRSLGIQDWQKGPWYEVFRIPE